jgi:DNA-binding cell septation regulator SpoVG
MTEAEKLEAEAKLRKLADRLDRGSDKAHPLSQKVFEKVREAVQHQWEKEKAASRSKKSVQEKEPPPKKTKGQGHDHGHSY